MSKEEKIDIIINEIINNTEYKDMCCLYGNNNVDGNWGEDAYQEFIITIMTHKKIDLLYELYLKKELLYYCHNIIKNMLVSSTSPFFKSYRQETNETFSLDSDNLTFIKNNIPDITIFEEEDTRLEDKLDELIEDYEKVYKWLDTQLSKDPYFWYDYELLNLYLIENKSFRQIDKETGIKYNSVFETIKKLTAIMKNNNIVI